MPFVHPVNVRYSEVDQQGVVFNAHYLTYFDDAMTAFLGHIGYDYRRMLASGADVMLVHTEIDWRAGVGFGDDVAIAVSCERVGTTSFTLGFEVQRAGESVCTGKTVYVCISVAGGGKREVPQALRAALSPLAGGRNN